MFVKENPHRKKIYIYPYLKKDNFIVIILNVLSRAYSENKQKALFVNYSLLAVKVNQGRNQLINL